MSKQNKNNTPRLRFPEFTGEWVEKKLGEIGSFKKGQAFSKDEITSIGDTSCIHYGELFTKYQEIITEVISKTNSQMRVHSECGDILFPASDVTPTGLARCSAILKDNVLLGGDIIILRPEIPLISEFLSYTINTQKESIIRLVTGAVVKHITPGALASLTVFLPPTLAEQQKIAECLMAIDGQISAQAQKVEALKEKKKGMMQQLFPQKGETTPRLRFPEFTGEWDEKRLGEVCDKIVDGSHNPPESVNRSSNYMLSSQNIQDGHIEFTNVRYLSDNDYLKENKRTNVTVGDVLLTIVGTIGRSCVITGNEGNITFQRSVAILKPIKSSMNSNYLMYCLQISNIKLNSLAAGGAQKGIYLKQLENFFIAIPPSLAEQQKIASCLSALDDQIAAETEKLTALKDHKKGLMQQLFPQPAK